MSDTKRLQLYLPDDLKSGIVEMAEKTGLSQNQLAIMALYSLVANWQEKGSFIFADLLNPEHRTKK
ncbi:ribbon-helix-helix domain-containing protein [Bacillus cereus]|nr:ribbon-helix-helix domain-containing protein [Bacillus cereus]